MRISDVSRMHGQAEYIGNGGLYGMDIVPTGFETDRGRRTRMHLKMSVSRSDIPFPEKISLFTMRQLQCAKEDLRGGALPMRPCDNRLANAIMSAELPDDLIPLALDERESAFDQPLDRQEIQSLVDAVVKASANDAARAAMTRGIFDRATSANKAAARMLLFGRPFTALGRGIGARAWKGFLSLVTDPHGLWAVNVLIEHPTVTFTRSSGGIVTMRTFRMGDLDAVMDGWRNGAADAALFTALMASAADEPVRHMIRLVGDTAWDETVGDGGNVLDAPKRRLIEAIVERAATDTSMPPEIRLEETLDYAISSAGANDSRRPMPELQSEIMRMWTGTVFRQQPPVGPAVGDGDDSDENNR